MKQQAIRSIVITYDNGDMEMFTQKDHQLRIYDYDLEVRYIEFIDGHQEFKDILNKLTLTYITKEGLYTDVQNKG